MVKILEKIGLTALGAYLGFTLTMVATAYFSHHKKEECVPYTHLLSEQVSEDGAYVIHKEGKTWICTL